VWRLLFENPIFADFDGDEASEMEVRSGPMGRSCWWWWLLVVVGWGDTNAAEEEVVVVDVVVDAVGWRNGGLRWKT
jgi:hypothetical protein